ncbi:YiiX family permuted papain-like enzyme [Flavobacterium sp. RHBU_3]|uniref:YiiX family permuted papain-like enzyme n=1 Tax=Flavobacterium sp. RHBU_3 TaxID=3391184 RepID=UPI003984D7C7
MKKILLLIIICSVTFACKKNHVVHADKLHNGDIIFQTSTSAQSKAIQLATHSEYSHCGVIYEDDGQWYVFEAVQPVKKTPLEDWIDRGQNDRYVIKRLKDTTALTPSALKKMKAVAKTMNGKDYDLYFEWNNDRIYCSELVWKLYKESTGLEIGHLKQLKDFDLTAPPVKLKLKERYGNNIPMDEKVISPKDVYDSELLETIAGTYVAP